MTVIGDDDSCNAAFLEDVEELIGCIDVTSIIVLNS
jgi:hypothetical protein